VAALNRSLPLPRTRQPAGVLRAVVDSFAYEPGGPPVLCGIDLTIRTGELVVVAGPSGSGKSTLALALAGLIPHRIGGWFRGQVTWQEQGAEPVDLTGLALHEAAQHVGIIFQNPEYQLIQYRVDAEVAFGPENLGLAHAEVVARVRDSLGLVGALPLAEAAISSLSGGQKQRVAIAAALAMAPALLVLDEPTSDLDPVGTREVLAVLHDVCHVRGHGVVVIEHKLDEVAPYADRVLLMTGGRVVVDDHPRRAFVPASRWRQAGVRPPELITLAERLPGYFGGQVPLTAEEAAARLAGLRMPSACAGGGPAERAQAGAGPAPGRGPTAPGEPAGASERVMTGEPAAISAQGVSVSFNGCVALRDVSLRVAEGEWVAVIGANGSGKTTLGSVLMGFVIPESGTVSCFGRPVEAGRISRQADRLGYLFQNVDDMIFNDTVAAELEFTRRHRVPAGPDAPVPEEVAALIGLASRLSAHPYALSGGERQRLALGALLTRAPSGLILDEPTTGLDEAHATALFDLLARVRTALGSLTCLLITHDMRLVARFADRVIVLRDGEVVLDTTPRRAFAQPGLLASCGVLAPAVSSLHWRLAATAPSEVALDVDEFLSLAGWPGTQEGTS
jgi:energy-coupling factor transporter ATP-binding protein EcfA2